MSNAIYKTSISALKYIQVLCSWLSFLLGFKASANPSETPLKSNPIKFKQGWRICTQRSGNGNSWSAHWISWRKFWCLSASGEQIYYPRSGGRFANLHSKHQPDTTKHDCHKNLRHALHGAGFRMDIATASGT